VIKGRITPVPRVLLSVCQPNPSHLTVLARPGLVGAASHPPRHLPDQAAPSSITPATSGAKAKVAHLHSIHSTSWRTAVFTNSPLPMLDAKATTATIRRQLIGVAAQVTRSARRSTLRLPAAWPWAEAWQQPLTTATGPPPQGCHRPRQRARPETEVETPRRPANPPRPQPPARDEDELRRISRSHGGSGP
jgi:hypothetical protein